MTKNISIIILNYNGWADTCLCLESVYQSNYSNYQVIVVDNGSGDDSLNKIRDYAQGEIQVESPLFKYNPENKPLKVIEYSEDDVESLEIKDNHFQDIPSFNKLLILKNDKNHGFARANNQAIKLALNNFSSDYIFLLNNDTVLDKDALEELIKTGEKYEKVGAMASAVYDYGGDFNHIQSAGGRVDLKRYPGYFPSRNLNNLECDWITGAALMIKKEALESNLLNEDFFFGAEDVDFCLGLKHDGFKLIVVPPSRVWHKKGISRQENFESFKFNIRTNLQLLKKHNHHYYLYLPVYAGTIILRFLDFIKKR